jgi:hypothetical protein
MSEELVVRRVIEATAATVFEALSDPNVQAEIDGSGMLKGAVDPKPLTQVGDVFTMKMHQPELGDYVMENTVFLFEKDVRIGWEPQRQGQPPRGSRWSWELDVVDSERSGLTQIYDWSAVTDPEFKKVFPRVTEKQIVATMQRLADHLGVLLEDS